MNKIAVSVLSFLAFSVFLVYSVDWGRLPNIISGVDSSWILASVIVRITIGVFATYRLRELLKIIGKPLKLFYVWNVANVGALISLLLPFSAGGFAMPYFLSKKLKSGYKKTLFMVFVDAYFVWPLMVIIGILSLIYFYSAGLVGLRIGSNLRTIAAGILIVIIAFSLLVRGSYKRHFLNYLKKSKDINI